MVLSPLMYFQKAIISHPSLFFSMINKTSSFMPALPEQFSPFHPGACFTHAQVGILKHEWTNFPDSSLPIFLTNSTDIFPILRKNFPHLIPPEITCPFLHSGCFVPLTASCGWLAFSLVGFFTVPSWGMPLYNRNLCSLTQRMELISSVFRGFREMIYSVLRGVQDRWDKWGVKSSHFYMLNTNLLRTAIVGSVSSTDYVNTVLHSLSSRKERNHLLNFSRFSAWFPYFSFSSNND